MDNRVAVLKTLLYSDIFDYPLKKEEIWRYLLSNKKNKLDDVASALSRNKNIDLKDKLYFLKGRKSLVSLRKKRERASVAKLKKANRVIEKLAYIPTIKFIGISGNLSLRNAEKKDDIDLFIIAKANTIWLTRLLVVLFLISIGVYRKRKSKDIKDKICANMFLDEKYLSLSRKRQDVFTAHEIAQLMPVINKKGTYEKLILHNKWILSFLPNSFSNLFIKKTKINERENGLLTIVDHIVKFPQILYINMHKTKEEVSDTILAFHPQDHKDYVLKEYKKKLRKYNL